MPELADLLPAAPAPRDLLWGIVYPALAAGCTWAFLGGGWFRKDARWVSSLAVAAAFCIAFVGLLSGPPLEPVLARDWIFWTAVLGVLLSPLEEWKRVHPFPVRLVLFGFLLATVLDAQNTNVWSGEDAESPLPALATIIALGLCGWTAVERVARRSPGAGAPLCVWAMAAAVALASLWSDSGLLSQLAGGVAAAAGAAVVLAWVRPGAGAFFAGGGAGLAFALLVGIVVSAHFYASLSASNALLLGAAPLAMLPADLPGPRKLRGARRTALRLGLVCLPLAIAVWRCAVAYTAAPGYGEYY